jgi:hypothetical protein
MLEAMLEPGWKKFNNRRLLYLLSSPKIVFCIDRTSFGVTVGGFQAPMCFDRF